jgi:hypothetical protein
MIFIEDYPLSKNAFIHIGDGIKFHSFLSDPENPCLSRRYILVVATLE